MSSDSEMSAFNTFDGHLHIIDKRFPLVPNEGYLPDGFSCGDCTDGTKRFPPAGRAIVLGSFQTSDQTYLIDVLQGIGPCFVGMSQLPASVSDQEVLESNAPLEKQMVGKVLYKNINCILPLQTGDLETAPKLARGMNSSTALAQANLIAPDPRVGRGLKRVRLTSDCAFHGS